VQSLPTTIAAGTVGTSAHGFHLAAVAPVSSTSAAHAPRRSNALTPNAVLLLHSRNFAELSKGGDCSVRILLFLLSISALCAQETVNYASVSGRVTDPSAAVVEGAQITARHTATNLTNTALSDRDGLFRFLT
jgi:hypothetical protein